MANTNPFVTILDLTKSKKLFALLEEQGFDLSKPPYTLFSGKKKGISCTLYQSGKLVLQGAEIASFIEFYLEPEILQEFQFTHPEVNVDLNARIGVDESGKGDFFGPLCIAGVYGQGKEILELKKIGVCDSKLLKDGSIKKIGREIQKNFVHHIVKINPSKYNELYNQFLNLNSLLAWGHATIIEKLVEKTGCRHVIVDQFANENVVLKALKKKKIQLELNQRHRAEEDLIVAAASILARQTFIEGLEALGEEYGMTLPKGASAQTRAVGKVLLQKYGTDIFTRVAKRHFKTLDAILC